MHPNKLQNLQAMGRGDRFDYFLHKVSDYEEVWGLHDNGWATSGFADGEAVPFWPEAALAMSCATAEWSGYKARSIPLGDSWRSGFRGCRPTDACARSSLYRSAKGWSWRPMTWHRHSCK